MNQFTCIYAEITNAQEGAGGADTKRQQVRQWRNSQWRSRRLERLCDAILYAGFNVWLSPPRHEQEHVVHSYTWNIDQRQHAVIYWLIH